MDVQGLFLRFNLLGLKKSDHIGQHHPAKHVSFTMCTQQSPVHLIIACLQFELKQRIVFFKLSRRTKQPRNLKWEKKTKLNICAICKFLLDLLFYIDI